MNHKPLDNLNRTYVTRRRFVQSATVTVLSAIDAVAADAPGATADLTKELAAAVQMQYMRPAQLEKAIRHFPVAFVPFGLIEWHGRHLPLGNDALKAHAILVKTAEQFGGVVYPPVYFHDGFPKDALVPVLTELFQKLKKTGFRVIVRASRTTSTGRKDECH